MTAVIELSGVIPTQQVLRDIINYPRGLNEPAERSLDLIWKTIRAYPPPIPTSTYVRTFDLQNSWQRIPDFVGGGRVESTEPSYNVWVKDPTKQAKIHKGRHLTTEEVRELTEPRVVEIYDDFIQEQLNAVP